jgi:hypothetical protein
VPGDAHPQPWGHASVPAAIAHPPGRVPQFEDLRLRVQLVPLQVTAAEPTVCAISRAGASMPKLDLYQAHRGPQEDWEGDRRARQQASGKPHVFAQIVHELL